MKEIMHWVNGVAVAGTGERRLPVWDPATGEQQAYVVPASAEETAAAVAAARAAQPGWRAAGLSPPAAGMFRVRGAVGPNPHEAPTTFSGEHGKTGAAAPGAP